MLTTTLDGLWALQVLTGIEAVAPELGLRPHLPSVEPKRLALDHPVAAELRAAGVIDDAGTVDRAVIEWLTVLSRRDVALVIWIRTPNDSVRVLLARFAQWWVVLERSEDLIRISGAGTASAEGSARGVLSAQIDRLCGQNEPASLRPVTLDTAALRAAADGAQTMDAFLTGQRLDADQLRMLRLAVDPTRSAQASIVAMQAGVATGRALRTHVGAGAVTVIDTPEGRLIADDIDVAGKKWTIIAPGKSSDVAAAVGEMMRRLPAHQEWFSHRKVV